MSDELIEAETAPAPVAKKAGGPSLATVLGLVLLALALGIGIYIGSIWQSHNSRTSRLKAKSGDFVQLQHRDDEDEFASRPRLERGDNEESDEPSPKKEPPEPNWYDKYTEELFPKPIQIVYWRNPKLEAEDVNLLLEFQDVEIMTINCETIDGKAIEKFLALPRIRRLSVSAGNIDVSTIENWKVNSKFSSLLLVNPNWSDAEMDEIRDKAKPNESLKDKLDLRQVLRPAAGA